MIVKSEKYWADLLEQYKLGSISKSDRFELEKRALDDPFLFDALEGYSWVSQAEEIPKKEEAKLLTIPRMAAAASLIFLVAMIFLLKNDNPAETSSDQSIAMVLDKNLEETESTKEIDPITESSTLIDEEDNYSSTPSQKTEHTTAPAKNTNNIPQARRKDVEEKVIKEKSSSSTVILENASPENDNPTAEINEEEIESDDVITTSTEDEVHIPQNTKKLKSTSNKSKLDLETSASGGATADNNGSPPIPNAKEEKQEEPSSTFYIVEPAIGKKDFEEFVKESIDNRELRQETPHDVTIEFNINENGELSNFLHIFNGCSECGGYAIYLLSSSGVWKTTPEGQVGRARYTLKF